MFPFVRDAVERVRYEALGENNYAGMRGNLASATEQRTAGDPIVQRSICFKAVTAVRCATV
mgnify:CR=1 FL=1